MLLLVLGLVIVGRWFPSWWTIPLVAVAGCGAAIAIGLSASSGYQASLGIPMGDPSSVVPAAIVTWLVWSAVAAGMLAVLKARAAARDRATAPPDAPKRR